MRLSVAAQTTYPKFSNYVQHEIPKVIHVASIVRAFNTIGQLNRSRLSAALRWASGPTIRVTALPGTYGEFTPNVNSNEIRIDTQVVQDFEAGRGRGAARRGNVYMVGVTLLHELIHWGDDQDGIDRPGEEGEEFERAVYGSVIG